MKKIGVSRDQIVGRLMSEVLGAEFFEIVKPYAMRALAGESVTFEACFEHSAGEPSFGLVNYSPDLDSESVGGWVHCCRVRYHRSKTSGRSLALEPIAAANDV